MRVTVRSRAANNSCRAGLCAAIVWFGGFAAVPSTAGPVDKVNVRRSGSSVTVAADVNLEALNVAGFPVCPDRIYGAILTNHNETISKFQVTVNDISVPVEQEVDGKQQEAIRSELANRGVFDPKDLFFVRTSAPPPVCSGQIHVEITYEVDDPEIAHFQFVAGAIGETALNQGFMEAMFYVNEPIERVAVPATSTWGLAILGLVVLAGAKARFGQRSRAAGR